MPEKLQFEGALLDETAYLIPESTKLTISPTIANALSHILAAPVETLMIYQPAEGSEAGEKGLIAMERLITALKQPEETVQCINILGHKGLNLPIITRYPNIKTVILLGTDIRSMGIETESLAYIPFIFNKLNIIISDNLEVITDADKKLLWGRLQKMFGLN